MKEIKAIIQPFMLDKVFDALREHAGHPALNTSMVRFVVMVHLLLHGAVSSCLRSNATETDRVGRPRSDDLDLANTMGPGRSPRRGDGVATFQEPAVRVLRGGLPKPSSPER